MGSTTGSKNETSGIASLIATILALVMIVSNTMLVSHHSQATELRLSDLRPQLKFDSHSPLTTAQKGDATLPRAPASLNQPKGSVRDIMSADDLHRGTLEANIKHFERSLNRSFSLIGSSESHQKLTMLLLPTQSRASLRYVGFGESELTFNPVSESMIFRAQLQQNSTYTLVFELLNGPIEDYEKLVWVWHY